jgi:hypothetical protein
MADSTSAAEAAPCPQCGDSPITVHGPPESPVVKVCGVCFLGDEPSRVDLVAELGQQIAVAQDQIRKLERTLQAGVYLGAEDRRRQAALHVGCLGISTSALESGSIGDLLVACMYLIAVHRMGQPHENQFSRTCCCTVCTLERCLCAVRGAGKFPCGYTPMVPNYEPARLPPAPPEPG